MSASPVTRGRLPFGPTYAGMALLQVPVRLGFARQVLGVFLRRLRSERLQRKAFAGYRPTRHDVFVTTFAKSGTNWMMQIAQQVAHRGAAEFGHIHDVVPWPDSPMPLPSGLDDARQAEISPTGLRVVKTHLAAEYVPYAEEARYLTVVRDPKEVMVSSYYFLVGLLGALRYVSFDEWYELAARPDGLAGAWARHTADYWAWRARPNVLVLTYPEILTDPRGCIGRVAQVMGVSLSEPELASVVERSSFAYMKRHASQFDPPRLPGVRESDRPAMVRRGRAGASDELLSPAQQVEIDVTCRAELRRLGSDFPYESVFELAGAEPVASGRRGP